MWSDDLGAVNYRAATGGSAKLELDWVGSPLECTLDGGGG